MSTVMPPLHNRMKVAALGLARTLQGRKIERMKRQEGQRERKEGRMDGGKERRRERAKENETKRKSRVDK